MTNTTDTPSVKIVEHEKKQGINGLGLAGTLLGGGAVAMGAGNMIGNMVNRYFGNNNNAITPAMVPAAAQVIQSAIPPVVNALTVAASEGGYVTKENLNLVREISSKDSEIAQLKAEKYADNAVKVATEKTEAKYDRQIEIINSEKEKLKSEVCDLKAQMAVNAVSDRDYRHYADCAYVRQPRAYMRERIVSSEEPCSCHCDNGHKDGCGHHYW